MKLHKLTPPVETYGDDEKLSPYDIGFLEAEEIDEAWYWYTSAPYEGDGEILMRRGNGWDVCDLAHCSCSSPTENIQFFPDTLENLARRCTKGLWARVAVLFATAGVPERNSPTKEA